MTSSKLGTFAPQKPLLREWISCRVEKIFAIIYPVRDLHPEYENNSQNSIRNYPIFILEKRFEEITSHCQIRTLIKPLNIIAL